MTTLSEALVKAFEGKEEPGVGAVADTWLTLGMVTNQIEAMLAAYFLQEQGISVRVPLDVGQEHEWNHKLPPTHKKYLDSEGVPKAPASLESITLGESAHLAVREFTAQDEKTVSNAKLSLTDKLVALEARILAQKSGKCYVVTNDTALIEQLQANAKEQGLNIVLLMPSTIERDLAHLLPKLELQLLIPGHVLAQLYRLGSGQQGYEGQPYVRVERKKPYTLGNMTITIDASVGVLSTDEKTRRVPSRTNDYGIPIAVVKDSSQPEVERAILQLAPQMPKRVSKLIILPESEKYFPRVLRLGTDKANAHYYESVRWARIRAAQEITLLRAHLEHP